MSAQKVFQIGVMIGNVHTQHPMELIRGICEAAKDEKVDITFFVGAQGNALDFWNGDENDLSAYNYQYNTLYDYAQISGLDAIIISYGTLCIYLDQDDREAFASKFRSVPLVILEEYDEESRDSFLISDNYGSMYTIVDHLLTVHGYKKILYLSGPKNNTDSNEREKAYLDAMQEHGLVVKEDMVEYGDYSSAVDELVERLLDRYPDAEAIVSANDEMASCIYKVCRKRGLVPGRDLAVTGYDDVEFAQRMDPPLTTANQDGLDMGYRALKCAVGLCRDPKPVKMKLPARFLQRQSCGCSPQLSQEAWGLEEILGNIRDASDKENIEAAIAKAAEGSYQSIATEKSRENGKKYYRYLIGMLLRETGDGPKEDVRELTESALLHVQTLCRKDGEKLLDISGFNVSFHQVMHFFMARVSSKQQLFKLGQALGITDTYLTSYVMRDSEDKMAMLLNRSWTAPATIQYMIEKADDEKAFYRLALENIVSQGAKSAFLYLMPEPLKYDRRTQFVCPEKLELVAECTKKRMKIYEPDKRPVVTAENGFSSHYPASSNHVFVAFMLFAKTYQYGIMLCEIEATSIGLLYGVALQISTAKAYMQISKQENEAKQKLYETLKELKDKNQVLSFMSETDTLTGLYNRRGFMERAMAQVNANPGHQAAVFFSDLDHLKQINDEFGHAEGDFALVNATRILKETVMQFREEGTVCGRIGGDEFISFMICEGQKQADEVMQALKENCRKFNETCDKPYYVEFSTGCVLFTCEENYSVPEITGQADACLYEAKKLRRADIRKEK